MVEGIRKKQKSYLFNVTLAFCRGRFKNNVFIMFVIMEKNGMSRETAGKPQSSILVPLGSYSRAG